MKRYLYIIIVVFIAFSSSCLNKKQLETEYSTNEKIPTEFDYYVQVTKISDGDTFRGLTQDKEEIRFRIYGIDAPEKNQPFGNKSKQHLISLIANKKVGIIVQKKKDLYGRPIVWVYTPEGKDVSAEMLKSGMAWHFKRFDNSKEYEELEKTARKNSIGLWSDKKPLAPWEYRDNNKKNKQL